MGGDRDATGSLREWRLAGGLLAVGTAVLFVGLMTGPTPGEDPIRALENIDDSRSLYVATNLVDLAGGIILLVAFFCFGRLLLEARGAPVLDAAGVVGTLLGTSLLLVVLILQTAVDPSLARRFVEAPDGQRENHLAVARAIFDFESGLFALALFLLLWGVAAFAGSLLKARGPALDARFLWFGIVASLVAGLTGVAYTFEALKWFGRLEPFLALIALVWIGALGWLIWRRSGRTVTP
jgi:Na+/melibiose symporter-like transporter